jgi:hypothetical protein
LGECAVVAHVLFYVRGKFAIKPVTIHVSNQRFTENLGNNVQSFFVYIIYTDVFFNKPPRNVTRV